MKIHFFSTIELQYTYNGVKGPYKELLEINEHGVFNAFGHGIAGGFVLGTKKAKFVKEDIEEALSSYDCCYAYNPDSIIFNRDSTIVKLKTNKYFFDENGFVENKDTTLTFNKIKTYNQLVSFLGYLSINLNYRRYKMASYNIVKNKEIQL